MDVRRQRRDGSWWDAELHTAPLHDPLGNPTGLLVMILDVTERKKAEIVLAEERNLLVTLMDTIPDTIYFKDIHSRFIHVNQAFARHFGMNNPAQMIGKTDFDFFREEHARPAYEDEQAIIRTGQPLVDKEEKETFLDGRTFMDVHHQNATAGWLWSDGRNLRHFTRYHRAQASRGGAAGK